VSVPIGWDELDDPDLQPDRWTIRTVLDRMTTRGDPFAALLGVEQKLPAL
jgi:bifunctional non-homologous end joining protein LigD